MKNAFNAQRRNMIDGQIKPFNVVDEAILTAFDAVLREGFVPDDWKKRAYAESDIPFGGNRFLLESALFARLIQDAGVTAHAGPGADILDVGCLWGYSSAVLAHFGGKVTACDTADFIAEAKKRARKTDKINFVTLEGGRPPQGVFDFVLINGAVDAVPDMWAAAVQDGGCIAAFTTKAHAVVFEKRGENLHQRMLFDARVAGLEWFEKKADFSL
jgi:protein-L-isoaspartate(D-aspartate) O-methyltransferase